jgi:segregation and condensation protein A
MVQLPLPAEFKATLESYQGPLDLLLYLIKKDEVDIFDIPIGRVTEQYCAYLSVLQAIEPNACGEFLVMAANLMEIKSRSLLPTEPALAGEAAEDPRIELVRQLLEYKKYKERAMLLARRIEETSRRFHRPAAHLPEAPPEEAESPLDLGNVSVWDLLSAFHRIQLALGERGPHRVLHEQRPMDDYITAIQARAEECERKLLFDELFSECRDIHDAIGFFLAILEMAKRRMLRFHQEVLFGPIAIEVFEKPLEEPAPAPTAEEAGPVAATPILSHETPADRDDPPDDGQSPPSE